ncbi:MAG: hypothetical protein K6A33_02465, partial [Clostridiales bacterium]|nr:hypothetical protein [Clostridiales bacterium]
AASETDGCSGPSGSVSAGSGCPAFSEHEDKRLKKIIEAVRSKQRTFAFFMGILLTDLMPDFLSVYRTLSRTAS